MSNLNYTLTTFQGQIQTRLNAVTSSTTNASLITLWRSAELLTGLSFTTFQAEVQSRLDAVDGTTTDLELIQLAAIIGKISNENNDDLETLLTRTPSDLGASLTTIDTVVDSIQVDTDAIQVVAGRIEADTQDIQAIAGRIEADTQDIQSNIPNDLGTNVSTTAATVTRIETDTQDLQGRIPSNLASEIDTIDSNVDLLIVRTPTDLTARLTTIDTVVDNTQADVNSLQTVANRIEADTQDIQATVATLGGGDSRIAPHAAGFFVHFSNASSSLAFANNLNVSTRALTLSSSLTNISTTDYSYRGFYSQVGSANWSDIVNQNGSGRLYACAAQRKSTTNGSTGIRITVDGTITYTYVVNFGTGATGLGWNILDASTDVGFTTQFNTVASSSSAIIDSMALNFNNNVGITTPGNYEKLGINSIPFSSSIRVEQFLQGGPNSTSEAGFAIIGFS